MGTIHFRKDGRDYRVDENATGAEIKKLLNLPSDSVLINARNEVVRDRERIGSKVRNGENLVARPNYTYW